MLYRSMRSANLRFWCLINVAGVDFEGPFIERSTRELRTILRLNVEAAVEMTHAGLRLRDASRPFRLINVSSLAAYCPLPIRATYAASKSLLLSFSLALREEIRDCGATVTVLCPAGLLTTDEAIRAIRAQGILGRITTVDIGRVGARTIDHALRGDAVYIPGIANQFLRVLGRVLPPTVAARLMGARWSARSQGEINTRGLVGAAIGRVRTNVPWRLRARAVSAAADPARVAGGLR